MSEAKAKKKKLSIPVKLAIALVLGVVAGLIFKEKASYVAFIGTLFIRLLKMCVYPLVLFSIIAGIANVADIVKLKKIGGQFLLYTFLSSAIGGVLGTMVCGVVVTVIYSIAADRLEAFTRSNIGVSMYVVIALLACVAAVLGIYGDLFASVVKRQCGI